jgi:hypothetical protein
VAAPDRILRAVAELTRVAGEEFLVTDEPVEGTKLYAVYASAHPLSGRFTVQRGMLGFRVPETYPDAHPEDSFFIRPHDIKLREADPVRGSRDVHRAGVSGPDYLRGTSLGIDPVLAFSWHLWDRVAWNRNKHTLTDHYTHCLRRFEQPEHD